LYKPYILAASCHTTRILSSDFTNPQVVQQEISDEPTLPAEYRTYSEFYEKGALIPGLFRGAWSFYYFQLYVWRKTKLFNHNIRRGVAVSKKHSGWQQGRVIYFQVFTSYKDRKRRDKPRIAWRKM